MKIEIDSSRLLTTLLGIALVAAFAWMWSINERVARIESPESMISRVETLEKLIFPISVEYEVRKRTKNTGREDDDSCLVEPTNSNCNENFVTVESGFDPKLVQESEDKIRSMIEQRSIQEARKRRGKPLKFKK